MIPPIEDYNELLNLHNIFCKRSEGLSDYALNLQDASYAVGLKRGLLQGEALRDEMLAALQNLENDDGKIPAHAWEIVQKAINTATEQKT